MLKILKWSYDLGVRQERVRIAAHLQVEGQRATTMSEQAEFMIRDNMELKTFKEKRLKRFELEADVNHRVEEIIRDIFQNKGDWIPGASLIFPDSGE
jgi:hypothetical protein